MFPIGGSNPEAAAERRRQELLAQTDLESHPGIRELKQWGKAEKERKRSEQQQREEETRELLRNRRQEELREVEQDMRSKHLSAGGTESGWEKAWPELRERILQERTLAEARPTGHYSAVRSAF